MYNGWANHATWIVDLHLSNHEVIYDMITGMGRVSWGETEGDSAKYRIVFADRIKSFTEEEVQGVVYGSAMGLLASDLLNAALSDVDWEEIADKWEENPEIAFG